MSLTATWDRVKVKAREAYHRLHPMANPLLRFKSDPMGYAKWLGITLQPVQVKILELLLQPPYKVMVCSGHNVGKTFLGAFLTNWWYDTRDPGLVITTAPKFQDVCDLLWAEVRLQRAVRRLGGFIGPRAPEMYTGPSHWAKGFVANRGESFSGRHRPNMLFIMDEATGIDEIYFATTRTQFQPTGEHGWIAFCNPVAIESPLYQEYMRASNGFPKVGWHVVHMDSRDHPNISLDLMGKEEGLVPGAVRVAQLEEWIHNWCDPLPKGEDIQEGFDFQWPADSGHWFHPGPQFESRVMGQWPSQGEYSVWPAWLWSKIEKSRGYGDQQELKPWTHPEIGCDVARFGSDNTAIHCQDGGISIHHEEHNGWSLDRTAGRLKQLAREMYEHCCKKQPAYRNSASLTPQMIKIKIDVDGMGAGVVDMADGYNFIGISASTLLDGDYRNLRSQLWFATKQMAIAGMVHLGRLDTKTLSTLRQQAMSPIYKVNRAGQNELEEKADTKKRLRRSPDSLDCLNLAFFMAPEIMPSEPLKDREPERASMANKQRRARLFR